MTAMPTAIPPTWTTGSTEVFRTGTWRAALARHVHAPSPCHQACPVNGDIAAWIGLARAGDWRGAWEVLTRHNPFPAIAGRICHHPCESACNRAGWDEAVSICKLERAVGDRALAEGWAFAPPAVERAGRVAVVGGGPAGLSAAFQLRRRGWQVTLWEATGALGGLMRHGIPPYRLARDVLDGEIARIAALGVDIRLGAALASPEALRALRQAHDAVFVATGAARPKRLPRVSVDGVRVLDGAAYLAASSAGRAPALGPSVVVIGGGSAAMDAARSARRAGHAVTVLALESRAQMPAQREELDEALAEGVTLLDGAMLQQLARRADGLRLHGVRVRFERGARPGEFRVEPLPGTEFRCAADAVLVSIGQDPDLAPFDGVLPADGPLLAAAADGATAADGVWTGGDVASAARFVTEAVGMGQRAALAIDRRLRTANAADADPGAEGADGAAAAAAAGDDGAPVPLAAIATWYHGHAPRAAAGTRAPAECLRDRAEVQLGLETAQALAEAARCFSCGSCTACDNCVVVCPDLAVSHGADGYRVDLDYCKGCGLCVRECPTGSMRMEEEAR
jgi:NADPH-dependent glutamate synthase beta subunit-like oxidoreductase/Pyruvate/2-oxoacid:ferredoxin oxidoreductase delta subunit